MSLDGMATTTPTQAEHSFALALALYTVRDETARDMRATLHKVAELGYDGVELTGYGGLTALELRAALDENGLRAVSSHVGYDALKNGLDREIDACLAIGASVLVLPGVASEMRTRDGVERLAGDLGAFGQRCHERKLGFGYHNHDWEFAPLYEGGPRGLDLLRERTDPALVAFELDVYWAAYAGIDPVDYLHATAARTILLHLKDMTAGATHTYIEVGDGTLDFPALLVLARTARIHTLIVENDEPQMPSLESARRSLANLRVLAGT